MFKEYEEFKQVEAKIDNRIEELYQEIKQKKTEREKAAATYKKMMVDDSAGIKLYTTAELNQAKMRAEELASEIQVAEERLKMVEDGKIGSIEGMLDKVKKGWERETQKLNGEIQEIFNAAREHRAKIALEIQKANKLYNGAWGLRQALNDVERSVGLDFMRYTTKLGIPEEPLFEEYKLLGHGSAIWEVTDNCILPTRDELIKAYKAGEVSDWVRQYTEEPAERPRGEEHEDDSKSNKNKGNKSVLGRLSGKGK